MITPLVTTDVPKTGTARSYTIGAHTMASATTLIDKLLRSGLSQADIARAISVNRSYICDIQAGRKHCSPHTAVLLAQLADEDPNAAMRDAMLSTPRMLGKRRALTKALKTWGLPALALALFLMRFDHPMVDKVTDAIAIA